jgi:putative ABC transport system permease protein
MFWRILWRLLWASRGRLALALVAVASGATVCAALVNLDLDAGDKLTREFRSLGANVVVAPVQTADTAATMDSAVMDRIGALHATEIIAAAPYLYFVAQAGEQTSPVPVIVAGAWFDQVARINSWWKVEGQWLNGRDNSSLCMVGREAARSLGLAPGSRLLLRYGGREASFTVAGVVTAGGSDDSQIFVDLAAAQNLAGLPGRVGLVQLSVRGSSAAIEDVIRRVAAALPELDVQPVRQLAAAEGQLLERIRGLLFATVALILVLTALGVLAAMTGLALERARDVGLMKALGGTVRRVMRFFLAEATGIGVVGGLIGCGAGMLLANWIGQRVFAISIAPRLVVLPLTVGLMVAVALAGALPLRLLGRVRPAEILRGE